ncbi:MAG: FixH family protein [Bdellovibrionales bacterium]|nr:FixH family protein [Bdellovibrionales bacterium]
MKKFSVIALFLFVGLSLFYFKKSFNIQSKNLEQDNDKVSLTFDYSPAKINLETPVEFTFELKDKEGKSIPDAKIEVEFNMNHSGMVPILTSATHAKDAVYQTQTKLTMLGDWIIFLTIFLPDGDIVKKEFKFKTE